MLIILATLALSVAVVAAAGIACFLDVAFHPPEYSAAGATDLGSSPLSRGWRTFAWFSATAERLTRGLIAARRDASEAHCTAAINCGAMDSQRGERAREPIVSRFCSARTAVTPQEILEIAAFLRRTQPEDRVETIRSEALANAPSQCGPDQSNRATAIVRCPLACNDGTCVAMPVRPIQCRVHCALFGHEVAVDAQAAVDGAEDGLRKAMTAAGLEDELYELNSAPAKALSVPDAADDWSRGKNPFAQCTPYSHS